MTELLNNAYNTESFRESGHKLVNLLADYLDEALTSPENQKVLPWLIPEKQLDKWRKHLKSEISIEDTFKEIIENSIHIHNPKYIGHQVSAPLPLSALADLLGNFLNNGQAIYEMGPVSQAMERIVIEWISAKLNLSEKAEGILTSGGTIGNLTALLAARQAKSDFDIWNSGVLNHKLAFMVSEHSHYSVERAVKIMGLGEIGLIKVKVDEKFRIDVSNLENSFNEANENGTKIIGLIANACTTAAGTYDFLDEIGDFCNSHKIWFHVDAAHGAAASLSEKYKYLLKGIEKADSVVLDFHKMFMVPALTTAVIFKNPEHSYQTFAQKAEYLLNKEHSWFNGANRTMECTKIMLSLRVYMALHAYGDKLFTDFVETTYKRAEEFAELIKETKNFELLFEPQSNIVCFRYIPEGINSEEKLNAINAEIRKKLTEDGTFYIVQTKLNNKIYLRTTIMNPFTKISDLKKLLGLITIMS